MTDEDQTFFADEQKVYDELCTEMNAAGTGGELKDEQIKDAKLNAEARKKLGGKSFCGPNRTFPVEDCAHHTAALRLLGRAKISDGAKEKIRACVERKGKTLKCSVASKTEDKINTTATEGTEISDELKALAVHVKLIDSVDGYDAVSAEEALKDEKRAQIKEILGHYHALDVHHKGCEPDLQYKIEDLHNALAERWGKDRWVAWAKKSLAEHIKAVSEAAEQDYEIELSVDETEQPTTLAEHYIIADQCLKGGMRLVSLAPRYIGDFEKGVDYKGDASALEAAGAALGEASATVVAGASPRSWRYTKTW